MTVRPRDALIKMEDVFTSRLQWLTSLDHSNECALHNILLHSAEDEL